MTEQQKKPKKSENKEKQQDEKEQDFLADWKRINENPPTLKDKLKPSQKSSS